MFEQVPLFRVVRLLIYPLLCRGTADALAYGKKPPMLWYGNLKVVYFRVVSILSNAYSQACITKLENETS